MDCKEDYKNEQNQFRREAIYDTTADAKHVAACVSVLTDGKVDLAKVQPIAFAPFTNSYNVIGERVGAAWGVGKIFM